METKESLIVYEYAHTEGAWTVASEGTMYPGFVHFMVYDGVHKTIVPLLLDEEQLKNTIHKLRKIPTYAIRTYDLFLMCVAGAASLSIKYGR
jgi:hypothetical protein